MDAKRLDEIEARANDPWVVAYPSDVRDLVAEVRRLRAAIAKHHAGRGNDRCWECDAELYCAAGLEPGDPQRPPIEEHRRKCDEYRAGLYGVPVGGEPACRADRLAAELAAAREREAGLRKVIEDLVAELNMYGPGNLEVERRARDALSAAPAGEGDRRPKHQWQELPNGIIACRICGATTEREACFAPAAGTGEG